MSAALREAFLRGASWGRRNANDLGYFKPSAEAAAKAHYPPKTEIRPRVVKINEALFRNHNGEIEEAWARNPQKWFGTATKEHAIARIVNGKLVLNADSSYVRNGAAQLVEIFNNPTETVEVAE